MGAAVTIIILVLVQGLRQYVLNLFRRSSHWEMFSEWLS